MHYQSSLSLDQSGAAAACTFYRRPPFFQQCSLSLRSLAAVEFSFRFTSGLRRRVGTGPGSRAAPMRVDGARFRIEGEGERRSIRFRR